MPGRAYRAIDRPLRLVFTWSSPATRFRDSIVTVTFQPSSNSSTVVEIHQVGLPDESAGLEQAGKGMAFAYCRCWRFR
jgi:uncharacterized protein YndB with AHSA1/START domain